MAASVRVDDGSSTFGELCYRLVKHHVDQGGVNAPPLVSISAAGKVSLADCAAAGCTCGPTAGSVLYGYAAIPLQHFYSGFKTF